MRVLLAGGGSGGHIKPLMAVAQELSASSDIESIGYIGGSHDRFARLLTSHEAITEYHLVMSGKIRRFANSDIGTTERILTTLRNAVDLIKVSFGLVGSLIQLRQFKPDVVFSKGGYPAVPVVLAARLLRVPVVTHDSDKVAGLANKITSNWAHAHLVTHTPDNYPYDSSKITQVGVPLAQQFYASKLPSSKSSRAAIDMSSTKPLLVVIGGSLGSVVVNDFVVDNLKVLAEKYSILHITGDSYYQKRVGHLNDLQEQFNYKALSFVEDDEFYFNSLNAADIVISRAGATSIGELRALKKLAVVIPAKQLRDQLENAEVLRTQHLAYVIDEQDLSLDTINRALTELSDSKGSIRADIMAALKAQKLTSAVEQIVDVIRKVASQ